MAFTNLNNTGTIILIDDNLFNDGEPPSLALTRVGKGMYEIRADRNYATIQLVKDNGQALCITSYDKVWMPGTSECIEIEVWMSSKDQRIRINQMFAPNRPDYDVMGAWERALEKSSFSFLPDIRNGRTLKLKILIRRDSDSPSGFLLNFGHAGWRVDQILSFGNSARPVDAEDADLIVHHLRRNSLLIRPWGSEAYLGRLA